MTAKNNKIEMTAKNQVYRLGDEDRFTSSAEPDENRERAKVCIANIPMHSSTP